jgi:hypothetical protein
MHSYLHKKIYPYKKWVLQGRNCIIPYRKLDANSLWPAYLFVPLAVGRT